MDDTANIYILVNNEPTGPFTLLQLRQMVADAEIPPDTLFAKDGMTTWEPLAGMIEEPPQVIETVPTIAPEEIISRCERLLEVVFELSSYGDARAWVQCVSQQVESVPYAVQALDARIADGCAKYDEAKRNFESQSFLKRTFGSHDSEQVALRQIESLRQRRARLSELVETLNHRKGCVPTSPKEKDLLVKTIRNGMKELKLKKKEAAAAMGEIKRAARVESEGTGKTWIGLYDSSLAADQRRGIRHAKEQALRPHEDEKESIDRRLLALGKLLIWLDKLQ